MCVCLCVLLTIYVRTHKLSDINIYAYVCSQEISIVGVNWEREKVEEEKDGEEESESAGRGNKQEWNYLNIHYHYVYSDHKIYLEWIYGIVNVGRKFNDMSLRC